jgi:DNA-binding NarL/FixJ family response regulator
VQTSGISPRPLTDAEWTRIERARTHVQNIEQTARQLVRQAWAEYDAEIAETVRAGASQTEIAERLGIKRQAVHLSVKRTQNR